MTPNLGPHGLDSCSLAPTLRLATKLVPPMRLPDEGAGCRGTPFSWFLGREALVNAWHSSSLRCATKAIARQSRRRQQTIVPIRQNCTNEPCAEVSALSLTAVLHWACKIFAGRKDSGGQGPIPLKLGNHGLVACSLPPTLRPATNRNLALAPAVVLRRGRSEDRCPGHALTSDICIFWWVRRRHEGRMAAQSAYVSMVCPPSLGAQGAGVYRWARLSGVPSRKEA
jgi:hypothetical protein